MSYSRTKQRDVKAEFWPNSRRERSLTVLPVVDTLEEEEAIQRVFKKWVLVLAGSLLVICIGRRKTDLFKAPLDSGGV